LFRRRLGNVDDPGRYMGAPIIYPDNHLFVVLGIGYPQERSKGKRRMSGGQQAGVENLPGRGRPSGEFDAVPGRNSLLPKNGALRKVLGAGQENRGKEYRTGKDDSSHKYLIDISGPGLKFPLRGNPAPSGSRSFPAIKKAYFRLEFLSR
jgi:hypothetical protein